MTPTGDTQIVACRSAAVLLLVQLALVVASAIHAGADAPLSVAGHIEAPGTHAPGHEEAACPACRLAGTARLPGSPFSGLAAFVTQAAEVPLRGDRATPATTAERPTARGPPALVRHPDSGRA